MNMKELKCNIIPRCYCEHDKQQLFVPNQVEANVGSSGIFAMAKAKIHVG